MEDLPHLAGRWLVAYRALWWTLLLLAVVSATVGQYLSYRATLRHDAIAMQLGLRLVSTGNRLGVPVSSQAEQAGFKDGQTIIAVDGQAVSPDTMGHEEFLALLSGPEGEVVRLRVRDSDGQVAERLVARNANNLKIAFAGSGFSLSSQRLTLGLIKVAHGALLITIGALLYRRRRGDPVAVMLSLAMLIWAIADVAPGAAPVASEALLGVLDRLRFVLFTVALLIFPNGRFRPRWTLWATLATLFVGAIGMFAACQLMPFEVYLGPAIGCVALAALGLRQRYRSLPPGTQRQQIKWVAFGLSGGLVLAASSRLGVLVLPLESGPLGIYRSIGRPAIFDVGTSLMVIGVLISMLRYRLYDADVAISRSASYAALTAGLIALFAACETIIQALSQRFLGDNAGLWASGIAAALAAGLLAPLHQRVADWTERRFRKGLVALERDLPREVGDLAETSQLDRLAAHVLTRIENALNTGQSALIIGSEVCAVRHSTTTSVDQWMVGRDLSAASEIECDCLDREWPLRIRLSLVGAGTIGWILLGARPDGTLPGHDDRNTLLRLINPVARAAFVLWKRGRAASQRRKSTSVGTA